MYEDEELRPYLVDPHKQTLIDLQYFIEKLKAIGHEALILMDANQAKEQVYQQQTHNIKLACRGRGFMWTDPLTETYKPLCETAA
jgi:hypothetical protein